MSIMFWRILFLASAGLFVIFLTVLLCLRLLKNRYYHSYHSDELIKTERTDNSTNSLYFTYGETRKYIKKYVICKTVYDKFIVCNFAPEIKNIVYYIIQYGRNKKPMSVLRIEEKVQGDSSKVVSLDKHCAYVNVIAGTVDGLTVNSEVIRPLSVAKIRLYSFLKSVVLFTLMFALRHALIELIVGNAFLRQYLNGLFNYIAIGAAFVLSVIGYFISVTGYRRKNSKRTSGGNLVYDFL